MMAAACNSISGVDDLDFGDADGAQSGNGAADGAGAAGTSTGSGTGPASSGTGAGNCGACDVPPSPCLVWTTGVCVDGHCEWSPEREGEPCDDDNPCTESGTCDGRGACVPGPECPPIDCMDRSCGADGCVDTTAGDGTLCGAMAAANRCCGGVCKDLTNDAMNCGGCGLECGSGTCEPIELTTECVEGCSPEPCDSMAVMTSGRCTCIGGGECPSGGQVCVDVLPVKNKCAPETDGQCAAGQIMIVVDECPNYCVYP